MSESIAKSTAPESPEREGVDFSKCQMDVIVSSYNSGDPIEFESFGPYMEDYMETGMSPETLINADKIGVNVAKILRDKFPKGRMISLFDDLHGVEKAETEAVIKFRNEIRNVLGITPEDKEGEDYLLVSETDKIKDAEILVDQLKASGKGRIKESGQKIIFVNPEAEEKKDRKITLRKKDGSWTCQALDASSYLKEENRNTTHLVVLPNSFKTQQDQVWEILKALGIAKPDTYHNIFFDKNADPENVTRVIQESIENEDPIFPESLNGRDVELIMEQCKIQEATSKEEIEGFAQAYLEAKELAQDNEKLKNITPEQVEKLIFRWAVLIDKENSTGFRKVPAKLPNLEEGLPHSQIPDAMERYYDLFANNHFYTPEQAYKEFEQIHPFKDGNGRVGDLLWKLAIARESGKWPEKLPPDVFE